MRFLIDLCEDDIAELDALARRNGSSRTAEVREAVRLYLRGRMGNDWISRGSGYWKDRPEVQQDIENRSDPHARGAN